MTNKIDKFLDEAKLEGKHYEDRLMRALELACRTIEELEKIIVEIVDSVPAKYDEEDPMVLRHAKALLIAARSVKAVERE